MEATTIDHHTPSTPIDDIGIRRRAGRTSCDDTPTVRACAGRSVAARIWLALSAAHARRYVSPYTARPEDAMAATDASPSPRNTDTSSSSARMQIAAIAIPMKTDDSDITTARALTLEPSPEPWL